MNDIIDVMINILNRELADGGLGEIPPDFYEALSIKVKELVLLETTSPSSEGAEAVTVYRDLVNGLMEDLVDIRVRKALNQAISGKDIVNLTEEEKRVIEPVYELIRRSRLLKDDIRHGLTESLRVAHSKQEPHYRLVRFIEATDKFIGADLKVYGPFDKSDVADVPRDNAKVLIDKNIAIDVSVLE